MDAYVTAFAWPIAALLCFLAFLFFFKKEIAERISNVRKVGKDGIDLGLPVGQDSLNQKKYIEEEFTSTNSPNLASYVDPIIQQNLEEIHKLISKFQYKNDVEKLHHMEKFLARLWVDNNHLFTFLTIFGSQFRFLNLLSSRIDIDEEEAKQLFSEEKDRFPIAHAQRSFKVWIDYLLIRKLIIYSDQRYSITQLGTDFLKFRIEWRITEPSNV